MADRRLRYQVDVEGNAIGNLDKLGRKSGQVAKSMKDDLDSTASKGKQFAQVLGRMADDIEADLEGTKRASEAMARVLGDDLAGEADNIVASFNRAGLSFDEIEQDAEELAAAFKRVEDLSQQMGGGIRRGADEAADGLDRVTNNADQSRSVLANMAGNTAQDFGELGGVVGSLGVGIGQLAEYAVDGNIALKNLAAVAGPLALLSVAGLSLNAVMAENTKRIERAKEVQEGYLEALKDTENAMAVTSATADRFIESDVIDRVADLGVNLDALASAVTDDNIDFDTINGPMRDFLELTAEGDISTNELASAMQRFGVEASPLTDTLFRLAEAGELDFATFRDLTREIGELATGHRSATSDIEKTEAIQRALGIAIEDTGTAATTTTPNLEVFATATSHAADAATDAADALDRTNDALSDLFDISDTLPVISDNLNTALREATEEATALAEATASDEDRYSAFLDVISNGAGQMDSYITALRESGVSAEDAAAMANTYIDQLFALGGEFGVTQQEAEDLRAQLGLDYPTVTAHVEAVGVREAAAWIAEVNRQLALVAENQAIIRARNVAFGIDQSLVTFGVKPRAGGGPVDAGRTYRGGERGLETFQDSAGHTYFIPGDDGQVTPNHRVAAASGSGVVVNIDARGADRDALGDAVWKLERSLANLTTRGDG